MKNVGGKNSSPFFQPSGKYIFSVGYIEHSTKVSHENFVQGNALCQSLKVKKKHVITPSGID